MKLCRRTSVFPLSMSTVQVLDFLPFWQTHRVRPGREREPPQPSTSATNVPST